MSGNPEPTIINDLSVGGPSGFSWSYATDVPSGDDNPTAGPYVQVTRESLTKTSQTETVDVYINPIVQNINPTTGQITDNTVPTNSTLTLSVTYTTDNNSGTQSTPPPFTLSSGASYPAPADSKPSLPTLGLGTYTATFGAQSTTTGAATVTISNLPTGSTLSTATLSDAAGIGESYGQSGLGLTASYPGQPNNTTAVLSFPPVRDEAGTTMTIAFQLTGNSTQYVSDFAVPAGDHTYTYLRDAATAIPSGPTFLNVSPTTSPNMVSYTDSSGPHTVTFQSLLDMAKATSSPRYTEFNLTDGTTGGIYQLSSYLTINSGLIIKGADSNVDLEFTFPSTVPGQNGQDYGAINLRSSHVTLEDLKINFSHADVDLCGGSSAIIDDQNQSQTPLVDINLQQLTIQAAYDPSYYNSADNAYETMQTIHMGDIDSGVIEDNVIEGGTTTLNFGPWLVEGNTYTGAVGGTVCDGVFGLESTHDVTIEYSTISNADPSENGSIDRFLAANNGGYDTQIVNNHVSDNVGLIAPNPNGTSSGNPRNNPEVILPEQSGVWFEGSTAATTVSPGSGSYGRRFVAVPSSSLLASGGTSLTLFILDGSSSGTAILVPQSFTSSNGSFTYFLLSSSLPTAPLTSRSLFLTRISRSRKTTSTFRVPSRPRLPEPPTSTTSRSSETHSKATSAPRRPATARSKTGPLDSQSHGRRAGQHGPKHQQLLCNVQSHVQRPGGKQHHLQLDRRNQHLYMYRHRLPTTYGRATTEYPDLPTTVSCILTRIPISSRSVPVTYYSKIVGGTVTYDSTATYFVDPREMSLTTSGNLVEMARRFTTFERRGGQCDLT